MAKLNIVSMLEQLEEEGRNPLQDANNDKDLKALHPWYGLKDRKGDLTRYPTVNEVGEELLPRAFAKEFVEAGGSFDGSCWGAVWGLDPFDHSILKVDISPSTLGRLQLEEPTKRMQNINLVNGVTYSCDITIQDVSRIYRGWQIKSRFKSMGIDLPNSLISIGHKPYIWVLRRFAENFDPSVEGQRTWVLGQFYYGYGENGSEEPTPFQMLDGMKNADSIIEFVEQYEAHKNKPRVRSGKDKAFRTAAAVKFLLKYKYWNPSNRYAELYPEGNKKVSRHATSEGIVVETTNSLLKIETIAGGGKFHVAEQATIRQKMGINVAQIGETYFAWEGNFEEHKEGHTLRAAINNVGLKSSYTQEVVNQLKETGKINFFQFQKATHSCIGGTRSFLKEHAPFLGALLEGYNSWNEFFLKSPASKEVFELTEEFSSKFMHRF